MNSQDANAQSGQRSQLTWINESSAYISDKPGIRINFSTRDDPSFVDQVLGLLLKSAENVEE